MTPDVAIAFDDPDLAIPWPLPPVMMSARDRSAPSLGVALKQLGQDPPPADRKVSLPGTGVRPLRLR